VDAERGSDSNSGTLSNPFRSIQRAVQATRQSPKPGLDLSILVDLFVLTNTGAILLRQGTFYLNETIHLGPEVTSNSK